jgi:hypothetical protein
LGVVFELPNGKKMTRAETQSTPSPEKKEDTFLRALAR